MRNGRRKIKERKMKKIYNKLQEKENGIKKVFKK